MTAEKSISRDTCKPADESTVSPLDGPGSVSGSSYRKHLLCKWRSLAIFILVLGLFSNAAYAKSTPDWEKMLEKGNHELAIGKIDEAIKIFEKKVDSHPESGACHTALGLALKKKGKFAEAKAQFREATTREPGYGQGFYELGSVCEGDKEWKEAEMAFQRYLELKPDDGKRKTVEDRIRFCQSKQ